MAQLGRTSKETREGAGSLAALFKFPDLLITGKRLVDLSDVQTLFAGAASYFHLIARGRRSMRLYGYLDMAPENSGIRVAVVEDRAEDQERLERLLTAATGFSCVGIYGSGEEALGHLPSTNPDVVLMDINLPGMSGIDTTRELKRTLPACEIMMLTVVEDHERIFQSLAAGATGYLLKNTPPLQLLEAIQELHSGGAPMSGQIARQVVAVFRPSHQRSSAAAVLSPLEEKVLHLLSLGLLYKEVAEKLGISTSTVRTHVWHIYRKLHVHNRTEAVLKARKDAGAPG